MGIFDISFKEKSILASFIIILLVYSKYFLYVFQSLTAGTIDKGEVSGLFIGAIISLIVYQVVFHIILGILKAKDPDEPNDERDRMISANAGNISGWVLGFAVFVSAGYIFIHDLNALWSANLLMLALVISQLSDYAMQLFYYRRGY